jgi:hypothetical protein
MLYDVTELPRSSLARIGLVPALSATACVLVLALVSACSARGGSLLPDAIGDWVAGDRSEYVGDDLFVYINGGAEIYHEHGFDRIEIRDYSRGGERVTAELYTMGGSAYGIYSYARSQSGEPVDIGAGGTVAEYYLHFWSGPYLVAVTSPSASPDSRAAVVEVGRGIGANLADAGEVPRLMALLPGNDCVAGSEIYVAGPIGLNSAAPIVAELFQGFAGGATCERGSTRLVALRWEGAHRAAAALERAVDRASTAVNMNVNQGNEGRVTILFDEDGVAVAAHTGDVIRIAVEHGSTPDLDVVFPVHGWEVSDGFEKSKR